MRAPDITIMDDAAGARPLTPAHRIWPTHLAALEDITALADDWVSQVNALVATIRAFSDREPDSSSLKHLETLSQAVSMCCDTCHSGIHGFLHDAQRAHDAELAAAKSHQSEDGGAVADGVS